MRFHPPGPGRAPSGIGRPAELFGPLSRSRSDPRVTSAKAGAAFGEKLEAEVFGVPRHRRVDIVDHVADVDRRCRRYRHSSLPQLNGPIENTAAFRGIHLTRPRPAPRVP